ncbi:Choline transport protein [Vanrija pseudolonga]|uniref:Choline transport protein n=1 Tax=Vanrija pseudolonga TaxID=143232 RepID=A0AAF1BGQ9_9TREE|nr:Choline transport protein [Vanrija pseudolonga]
MSHTGKPNTPDEKDQVTTSVVDAKYDHDDLDPTKLELEHIVHAHGLSGAVTNVDELKQGFSIPSLMAVALVLGGAWAAVIQTMSSTIIYGGAIVLIYGLWITGFGFQMIYLSLAEMASAWPTSSGPQEWAFQLFPAKWKRFGSYGVAWTLCLVYIFATMISTVLEARQILGLVAYAVPSYSPTKAQVWALNTGLCIFSGVINIFGIKAMHRLQTFSLVWFCVGFLIWLIVPVAVSPTHAPPKEVFGAVLNVSGWSDFVAVMIACGSFGIGYGVPDAVTHLAEETSRPHIDIPRAMVASPIISLVTATATSISILFCGVDLLAMATTETGVPYLYFLDHTLRSRPGVICLSVIILYSQFMAIFECQLTSSRSIFAFAREGGAFAPKYLGAVHHKLQVPVWAVLFNVVFCSLFTLILLGSDTALNSLFNSAAGLIAAAYLPLIGMHLLNKRHLENPGPMRFGRIGWFYNASAVAYLSFTLIFYHFPYSYPFDKDSFNYNIAIVPGLLGLGVLAWFTTGHKSYILNRNIE